MVEAGTGPAADRNARAADNAIARTNTNATGCSRANRGFGDGDFVTVVLEHTSQCLGLHPLRGQWPPISVSREVPLKMTQPAENTRAKFVLILSRNCWRNGQGRWPRRNNSGDQACLP